MAPAPGYECGDMMDISIDDLIAQIDDLLDGHPAEERVLASGDSIIVSPTTGQVYGERTAEERQAEMDAAAQLEARRAFSRVRSYTDQATVDATKGMSAAEIWAIVADLEEKKARIETEREQARADREAERVRQDDEARAQRRDMIESGRQKRQQREKEYRARRRRELADLHERQDRQGLQRTNLDGKLLCDSCQRVYHEPDFDYCYGCKRGRKASEHRARMASGEIAERKTARQAVREAYLRPQREAELAEQAAMRETRDRMYQQALADAGVTEEELREYALRKGVDGKTVRFSFSYKMRMDLLEEIATAQPKPTPQIQHQVGTGTRGVNK